MTFGRVFQSAVWQKPSQWIEKAMGGKNVVTMNSNSSVGSPALEGQCYLKNMGVMVLLLFVHLFFKMEDVGHVSVLRESR